MHLSTDPENLAPAHQTTMSANHSLAESFALGELPHMETVTVPFRYLRVPNKTDLIHECKQPWPKILCTPEIDWQNGFQAVFYINAVLNLHSTDLIMAAGNTCAECKAPSTKVLYLLSYVVVHVLSVCNEVLCIDEYQDLETNGFIADCGGVPISKHFSRDYFPIRAMLTLIRIQAVCPHEKDGVGQCLGCRGRSTRVKQRTFTMPEPRPHIKMFSNAVCDREKCRSKADGLKVKDSSMYGPTHGGDGSCAGCGKEGAGSKCGNCKSVDYCGKECQKKQWKTQKVDCRASNATS